MRFEATQERTRARRAPLRTRKVLLPAVMAIQRIGIYRSAARSEAIAFGCHLFSGCHPQCRLQ